MWDLYDQEKITEMMIWNEIWNVKAECFKRLMENMNLSFEQAADALGIADEDRIKIKIRLDNHELSKTNGAECTAEKD